MATFRVKARTVDMLGRQQIAGIPTAISELFKNAHDAYARNVEVDYFRGQNLLILRDDGLGMSKEDFEQRWLTLGTESKIGSTSLKPPPRDPEQPLRPTLGEKGIGRLAIAIIGPQVLVLSRARVNKIPSSKLVAAYIHWGLFQLPGVDLEDLVIPLREFRGGTLPKSSDIEAMVREAAAMLDKLAEHTDRTLVRQIHKEMRGFTVDPVAWIDALGTPNLIGDGCGTHFFIQPADSIIRDDIDGRQAEYKATRFERNLIGFTNTMLGDHKKPPIVARFRDHRDEGEPIELIGDRVFFTPEEFKEVDHHFVGRFDEYGQFQGNVGIYQMKPEKYVLSWKDTDGRPTECGPFTLQFAYMQGQARDSLVPPEEHARLVRKLNRHGGLYIYRDGIRVQPYGDSDYDWLDIERNRTLGASYYFYSYRRMFGVIDLTQRLNSNLTEKAGREGFRENLAYRQMRSILMNFFLQTAADYFREDGKYAEGHSVEKSKLNKNEEIRRVQASRVRNKKSEFQKALNAAFSQIDERLPYQRIDKIVQETKREADLVLSQKIPGQQKAMALMRLEKAGRDTLHLIRRELTVTKPRGVGLSRELANEWRSYSSQIDNLNVQLFDPSESEIERYVSIAAKQSKVPLNDVTRLNSAISEFGDEASRSIRQLRNDVGSTLTNVATGVREVTRTSFNAVTHAVDGVMAELDRLQRSSASIGALTDVREKLVVQITTVHETERKKLERLRDQLNEVPRVWEVGGYDTTELTEALEEEVEELRRRRDADLELAQIGLALSTISHEFDKTVGLLRRGLKRLEAWAGENPDLRDLYRDLKLSFDHLDGYLTLFTPLDHRVHQSKIRISGKEISDFLTSLFASRLKRHNIVLKVTKAFTRASVLGYPSSIYPAFVNLVDNSIFWLQRRKSSREISLDAEGSDLVVRDNGPGVSARDRENIFLLNFSRKPGGRGMGLHISKQSLAKAGLQLSLDERGENDGAAFRIKEENDRSVTGGKK